MSKPQNDNHRIEVTSHLRWVRLDQMKINPQAQRALNQAWVDKLSREFDPDKMGFISINLRDGWYYVIDGQHRRAAAIAYLGSDQQVQCHVYENLTVEEEARLFLELNQQLRQGAMSKYKVALTAGSPVECDVDRIARALGLKVGSSAKLEEIACVTALLSAYKKRGPGPLSFALRVIRDAFGYEGFKRDVINGLTSIIDRYGNRVDEEQLVKRLKADGIVTLHRRSNDFKNALGAALEQCYAAAIVESFNRQRGGSKLQPWFNFQGGVS